MGRRFASFEVVVHFTEIKKGKELQKIIDDFYIENIKAAMANSHLAPEIKNGILERIAAIHQNCTPTD